jgi:hypothetical protein
MKHQGNVTQVSPSSHTCEFWREREGTNSQSHGQSPILADFTLVVVATACFFVSEHVNKQLISFNRWRSEQSHLFHKGRSM